MFGENWKIIKVMGEKQVNTLDMDKTNKLNGYDYILSK